MSRIRIICTFIIILTILPNTCMAAEYVCIYGVTIHLKNNKKLDGYIETYDLKEDGSNKITLKSYLEMSKKYDLPVRFINKLFCVEFKQYYEKKYRNISSLLVTESSYQTINAVDIKSIKGVYRKGDSHCSIWNITRITDHMAEYISNHKLIAGYYYYDDSSPQLGPGVIDCHITYLSYNPQYTQQELIKHKKKLIALPEKLLEKEKLIRITKCAD
jgi:hypothetical protein